MSDYRQTRRWRVTRQMVFERDGFTCVRCGSSDRLEADHITPLAFGGAPYDLDNVRTLCKRCHAKRGQRGTDPLPPAGPRRGGSWYSTRWLSADDIADIKAMGGAGRRPVKR